MRKAPLRLANLNTFTFSILLLCISTIVFSFYIWFAQNLNHFEKLQPQLDGTAARPYVYRVLAPMVIRALSQVGVQIEIGSLLMMYLSLIGFSCSLALLFTRFLPPAQVNIASLLAPLGLIPFLLEQRHIYDFPTLFLFTLSLGLLAHKKFTAYLIVFALTCLSKETALFLIPFFAIQFRGMPRRQYLSLLVAQLSIYTIIRLGIMWQFRENPGGVVEFHLYDQIAAYRSEIGPAALFALFIVFTIAVVLYRWREKPLFLRNGILTLGLPIALLYIFFGMPYELRVFLEVYPVLYLLAFMSFISIQTDKGEQPV